MKSLIAACTVLALFASSTASPQQPAANPAAAATNSFALDLYQQLAGSSTGNLWFSPWSITSALAMTAEGARGDTLTQMTKTLRFGAAQSVGQLLSIHEGMAALSRQLNKTGSAPTYRGAEPWQLVVANALWGDQQYPFDQGYVDAIRKHYGVAGVTPLDFRNSPEAARSSINAWVEEQTRQKITNLLPTGSVDPTTSLVLTNAVYFKGNWTFPFTANATTPQSFHLDAARTVVAPLMRVNARLGHMQNDRVQALALPFSGESAASELTMVVILPKQVDGLAAVEKSLSAANLDTWIGALDARPVQAFLPKFRMTNALDLGAELAAMGMPDAFSASRADFSGISPVAGKDRLHISAVLHKSYLAIDEDGAEAAAATANVMFGSRAGSSRPEDPVVFRADHPFLVLLRHNPSGAMLFLGRVVNPGEQ